MKTIRLSSCVGSAIYAARRASSCWRTPGAGGPTRVAGQVITGVGFIGGGAISRRAARSWAHVGGRHLDTPRHWPFVGAGYPLLAIVITATVVTMLVALRIAEERVLRRFQR